MFRSIIRNQTLPARILRAFYFPFLTLIFVSGNDPVFNLKLFNLKNSSSKRYGVCCIEFSRKCSIIRLNYICRCPLYIFHASELLRGMYETINRLKKLKDRNRWESTFFSVIIKYHLKSLLQ